MPLYIPSTGGSGADIQELLDAAEGTIVLQGADDVRGVAPTSAEVPNLTGNDLVKKYLTDDTCEWWLSDADGNLPASPEITVEPPYVEHFTDRASLAAGEVPANVSIISVAGIYHRRALITENLFSVVDGLSNRWTPLKDMYDSNDAIAQTLADVERMAEFAWSLRKPFINLSEFDLNVDIEFPTGAALDEFITDNDEAAYNEEVKPEFRIGMPGSQFDLYADDIKRFNFLCEAFSWYDKCPKSNVGRMVLRFNDGLHGLWGHRWNRGLMHSLRYQGRLLHRQDILTLTYAASPRGTDFSRCTVTLGTALPANIVVGMGALLFDIMSAATNHSADSTTPIVTDDAALASGAHYIATITTDRLSFTFDVPHPLGQNGTLTSPTALRATPFIGPTAVRGNQIAIPHTAFALRGGFDGRNEESIFRIQYGGTVEEEQIVWVDHTDPTITVTNGFEPARKVIFGGNMARYISFANCGYIGGEERVVRFAKLCDASFNRAAFGLVGKNIVCARAGEAQLSCRVDFTSCVFGVGAGLGLLATSFSLVTAQNCTFVGGQVGVTSSTGGLFNLQSGWIYGCLTGVFISAGCVGWLSGQELFEGDLVIENCTTGVRVVDGGTLRGPDVIYIGNDTNIDDQNKGEVSRNICYQLDPAVIPPLADEDFVPPFTSGAGTVAQTHDMGGRDITISADTAGAEFVATGFDVMLTNSEPINTPANGVAIAPVVWTIDLGGAANGIVLSIRDLLLIAGTRERQMVFDVAPQSVTGDLTLTGSTVAASVNSADGDIIFDPDVELSEITFTLTGIGYNGLRGPKLDDISFNPLASAVNNTPILKGVIFANNQGEEKLYNNGVLVEDAFTEVSDTFIMQVEDITILDPNVFAEAWQTGTDGGGAGKYYSVDNAGNRAWFKV